MSEYLDYIADVEDVKTIVNELAFNMYQQGISDERPKAFAKGYDSGYQQDRADAIEIVHRFFMDEMNKLETYIDEDDGISEIYKDTKKANYLLNMNKRLCEQLKEQKNGI